MYVLVIRYFTLDDGLKNYLLDFYEDAKETANDIFVNLKTKLVEYNFEKAFSDIEIESIPFICKDKEFQIDGLN